MPNWVMNKVKFTGSEKDIKAIKTLVKTEDNQFDFQKIVPMPESLNLESSTTSEFAIRCAQHYLDGGIEPSEEYLNDKYYQERMSWIEWVDFGIKYLKNMELYGAYDWYDWSIENWGTKWNSCDADWYENEAEFTTAWDAPVPIFCALAQMFPNVEIEVCYADEDLGSNCGTISCKGNECVVDEINTREFACSVWDYYDDEEDCEE